MELPALVLPILSSIGPIVTSKLSSPALCAVTVPTKVSSCAMLPMNMAPLALRPEAPSPSAPPAS